MRAGYPVFYVFIYCCLAISACHAQSVLRGSADGNKAFIVPEHFNGFNTQMMRGPGWKDPGFIDAVKLLEPGLIRYPGGTVASYWDWKTGWLMKGIQLRRDWAKIPENPITLDDLKFACDATGAWPVFVLNMMNSTVEYQMEMLRTAVKMGLTVKYIELDNEIYLGEEFYIQKFPTGKEYALEANKWIVAIRKEFPEVKIGVVGCAEKEIQNEAKKKYAGRSDTWNRDVFSELKGADAMTFHIYGGTGMNAINKASGGNTSGDKSESFQAAFDKAGTEPLVLGIPYSRWKITQSYDYPLLPSNMKVWITEYNMFEKEGVVAGTWLHGMYALLQSLLFMDDQKTGLICYHNLTTSAQFAAIFNNENGFDKSVRKKPTQKYGLTASGYTLSFFGEAMRGTRKVTPVRFKESASLRGLRGLSYPAVSGWLMEGTGKKLLVMNMSDKPNTVDVSQLLGKNASWKVISSAPKSQVAASSDITGAEGSGSQLTLPPYSVGLIEAD
ncbi:MAG TPA: hypothetical protein VFW78_08680 [Bacteroidia bacterium]|nr:hypothetical protein [Bacteroidia bacterium]